jgi:hypothetical protein
VHLIAATISGLGHLIRRKGEIHKRLTPEVGDMSESDRTVFQTWESKNTLYNRLFETINQEADPSRRKQLGKAFDELRRAVREWDKLIQKASV